MDKYSSSVIIYPNPANTQITIETHPISKGQLTICNLNGQEIMQQQLFNSKTQLDISSLSNGVYLVKVVSDGRIEVKKIVKE